MNEDTFKSWGAAPGTTEQQKMDNAEVAIKKAIKANATLAAMDISIIPQGSYRARTNVRRDSDVDICVCLNSTFFPRYPAGKTKEHYGNIDGTISHEEFKKMVEGALFDYFGRQYVTPGNKAFDIHSNSYRVDADVVPALAYKFYFGEERHHYVQPTGVAFNTGDGNKIINWPHQTYENGKAKHERTGQRFKKMVRIVKTIRNKMQEENIPEANDVASFLIESLVWNVPDEGFNHTTYSEDVRYVLAHCFNETLPAGGHAKMCEVNDIKLLFGLHQAWTLEKTHNFFSKAWDYAKFQ